MGKQTRRKTRKDKISDARLVACGKRIGEQVEIKVDYDSLSPMGREAVDNVALLTGKSRVEILRGAK